MVSPMLRSGPGHVRLASISGLLLISAAVGAAQAQEAPPAAIPSPPPGAALPEVEPIIPDAEFEEAVPPVAAEGDAELDRPLESIEEFERRIAGESADVPQPGDTSQEVIQIGDAAVRDPELTRPLEPLDQFRPEPVDIAEAAGDDEPVEIGYTLTVTGLEAADEETRANMRGLFDDLSALRDGGGKAANRAMVAARLEEDRALMRRILESEGWYSPRLRTSVDRAEGEKPLAVTIDVTPGQRYSFGEIVIDAPPTVPPDLIRSNFAIKVGDPIVAERVQGAEAQVALALPENGYPFAEIGQRDILLDRRTGTGAYTLPIETGPRSRFDGFATQGDLAFDIEHIGVLARFERGELYDSRKVDDLRKALLATGLFANVGVEPQRTGEGAGDGTEYVRMMVEQDAGPPRTIAGTAGYATGEGLKVQGSWTHRNLFPPEGALIVHGTAGTAEQGAGVTFRRSNAGKRDRTFELTAEALHSDFDAYSAYTGRLAARISRESTPIWQKRFTYAYGIELLGTAEKDYDFAQGRRVRRTYYIAGLTGQAGFDTSDDLLNPTRGYRFTALIQPEGSLRDGFHPYVRARLDGSGYFSVSDDLVLAARFRLGTIQGASREEIAPSRRLYAGGGGSVRGYGYQKLGPLDPDGDPLGGRSLNEASAEVRYRFGNFGVVAFVDAGQAYASTTPRFSDLRYGAGIGGRYYTNFGPLRVDIATPIDRRPGESRFNIYVSIGQAF